MFLFEDLAREGSTLTRLQLQLIRCTRLFGDGDDDGNKEDGVETKESVDLSRGKVDIFVRWGICGGSWCCIMLQVAVACMFVCEYEYRLRKLECMPRAEWK